MQRRGAYRTRSEPGCLAGCVAVIGIILVNLVILGLTVGVIALVIKAVFGL